MLLELLGLLLVTGFCLFIRAKNIIWIPLIAISIFMIMVYGRTPFYLYVIYWAIFFMVVVFGSLPAIRLNFIARPFFNYFKKVLPPISQTEREAIDAGDTYWEADLFQGRPDWDKLHAIQKPGLTTEEQAFVDNQVDTLCGLLNDWKIVYEDNDMPENVWQYLKK